MVTQKTLDLAESSARRERGYLRGRIEVLEKQLNALCKYHKVWIQKVYPAHETEYLVQKEKKT